MGEPRNWLEMPDEIMGGMILQRLDALQILKSAQKVCTTWRRICKDPVMWKIIRINHRFHASDKDDVFKKLIKQAVHCSRGELIDISLEGFATDELLDYISQSSSRLKCVRLTHCNDITGCGLINALKRLPLLETLELSYIHIYEEDIEAIGRNCLQLKSLKMQTDFMGYGGEVDAIANSMPALRHLQLVGTTISDDEIKAILNGCPYLESLYVYECFMYVRGLDRNLEKLCRERIKDFKSDIEFLDYDDLYETVLHEDDDCTDDDGLSGGSAISAEDDYDDLYETDLHEDDDCTDDDGFSGGSAIFAEDDYDNYWLP